MKLFGVLGDPVSHSLSPVMHNAAFKALGMECEYYAFRVGHSALYNAIHGAYALGFGGLSLTIPLKEKALEIVNPSESAKQIGAVNTVDFKNGLLGYNTDGIGAKKALVDKGINIKRKRILILGAGGAARAVAFELAKDGANISIANRTYDRAELLAREVGKIGKASASGLDDLKTMINHCEILINTTAVGMFPRISETIVTSDMMHSNLVVFDIVYNPVNTLLLEEARKAGAKTIDGVMMLVHQGAAAFEIWTGETPPIDVMERVVREKLG
jgi:shikimate dehydrogenase